MIDAYTYAMDVEHRQQSDKHRVLSKTTESTLFVFRRFYISTRNIRLREAVCSGVNR